ncbi:MAG: CopG family antitoxin [Chloroflexota bacterium]
MKRSKTSISKATTYKEIAEFWDTHSLADYWEQTKPAEFQVNIQSEVIYYPLAHGLAAQIRKRAKRQGVRPETLLNMWVQEKLQKA